LTRTAVIGFGELGEALARAAPGCAVWSRAREGLADRVAAAGGRLAADAAEAARGAQLVLVCVPGTAVPEVAAAAAGALGGEAVWADLASAAPEAKAAAAAALGPAYVDAAVLGAVAAAGPRLPVLAAGPRAESLARLGAPLGLDVTVLEGPPGAAARVKLLRSVYLKGRDALVAEMLAAARAHGVAEAVAASIAGPGEEVPFRQLAARIEGSLARHAARRADELAAAAEVVRSAAVEPAATEGAVRRLRLQATYSQDLRGEAGSRP